MRLLTVAFGTACGLLLLQADSSFAQSDSKSANPETASSARQSGQDQQEQEIRAPEVTPKSVNLKGDQLIQPMRLGKGRPIPVIKAKVNGQGPFLFFLDTGASTTTLDHAFTKKLNLPVTGQTDLRGPGNGPGINADIVMIDQFVFGDLQIEKFEAAVFDRSSYSGAEEIVGSLGLSIFGELPVTLDFPNEQLIVGGEALAEEDKNTLACDFTGPVPFFDVQLSDSKFAAAFDSGFAGQLMIGEESIADLEFVSEPKVIGRARTVSDEIEIKGAPVKGNLQVGEHVLANPQLTIIPTVLTDREICVLGHAWAREMLVTYDAKNQRVRFQHSPKPAAPKEVGPFSEYVGKYGPRTVSVRDGKLMYQRNGGFALELKRVQGEEFKLTLPPGARSRTTLPNVRFERNEQKQIKGFSLVRGEEVEEYVEKAKDDGEVPQ